MRRTNKNDLGNDIHAVPGSPKRLPSRLMGQYTTGAIKRIVQKQLQQAGLSCDFEYLNSETRFGTAGPFTGDSALCDAMQYVLTPPNVAPNVTISSPQAGSYEIGNGVTEFDITINIDKITEDCLITDLRLQRRINGSAWSTIYSETNPFLTGNDQVVNYTDSEGVRDNDDVVEYRAQIDDDCAQSDTSNTITRSYRNRLIWGFNPNDTGLTENDIETQLTSGGSTLVATRTNFDMLYSTATPGNYKYIAYPDTMGDINDATSDIIDTGTGFPVPFILESTVSVTNGFGYTQTYNLYRSVNIVGGTQTLRMTS